ncbi:MAG: TMEM43 family protein [Clostridia bacterium]|nr:TMEM43 family protein [Clostridia bacterium]
MANFSSGSNKKGGLFAGVLVGILMVIIGTVLLWWNEGNNVRNIKTTDEIEKSVVEITPEENPDEVAGQLVAVGGKFVVEDVSLSDKTFGISAHTAVLTRVVEVYQWEEESHSDDDGTTYTYKKVWHEGLIDSSNFSRSGHDNPTSVAYESESEYAETVTLGNFHLSSAQIQKMDAEKSLSAAEAKKIPKKYSVAGNYVTNSADLDSPEIGDVRISWKYNDWKEVSLIAQATGTTFVSWTSAVGKKVNWVTEGTKTSAEMIQDMRTQDKIMKWLLRLLGFILIFTGYMSFISPLTKLVGYIPILGNVVNFTFGLIILLLSLIQSLLVIIVAWFRFRPLLSICLLVVAAGIGVLIYVLKKKHPTPPPAQPPVQPAQTV